MADNAWFGSRAEPRASTFSPHRRLAGLGLSLALYAATGCGDGSDLEDSMFQPPPINAGGFTSDASAISAADGSLPPSSAGDGGVVVVAQPDTGVASPLDGGPGPVVTPEGGSAVPDTGVGEGGSPEAGPPARTDQGMGDGKDVVTIGDSWMNLDNSIGIQQSLEKISKRDYRNYGVPGTKLLDEVIPNQYKKAKMEGTIKTVVMTGGGNDVLQEILLPCLDANFDNDNKCKAQIDRVAERLKQLWAQMAADGVLDVYIIGYSSKTSPIGLGTTAKSITYSSMKIDPICQMVPAPLRCTAMDTDKEVPGLTIGGDGIHPTAAGYDLLGTQVWKVMQEKGMRR
jgi:lysophospholipase L1-like esterase